MSQLSSILPTRMIRRRHLMLLLATASACDRAPASVAVDSLLQRDLTLARAASRSPIPSALSDTAASAPRQIELTRRQQTTNTRPTPKRAVDRPTTSPPLPAAAASPEATVVPTTAPAASRARGSIGTGSVLVGRTSVELCSLANRPGDRIVATLSETIVASDGTLLRAGTPLLVQLAPPGPNGGFNFLVKAVQVDGELLPIDGRVTVDGQTTERKISKGGDKGKVIGGAIAGAILGRVLGGGAKGTVIGAAGGAAAGTIAASRNTVTETCLPAGAKLIVTLSAPLVLIPGVP